MQIITQSNPSSDLDAIFAALSDPTRRAMLSDLAQGERSVQELAAPFDMSQPAISKHLKVLEKAGLVTRSVKAQQRPAHLNPVPLQDAIGWLEAFQAQWADRLDQLDVLLETLKSETKDPRP